MQTHSRLPMKGFFIVLTTMLLLIACKQEAVDQPNNELIKHPNVLFVSIDDLNDWVEPLAGNSQTITPNLNAFAKQSVNFKKNYCTSPGCNPSRSTLLMGMHTYSSGMYSNYQDWREVPAFDDKPTLPRYFRDHDYYTAGAGKIFHYSQIDSTAWDTYYPSIKKPMPDDIFPPNAPAGMPPFKHMYGMFDWAGLDIPDEDTGDYKSVEFISNILMEKHDKPFFLACGIYRPHLPWYVPQKYFDRFPLKDIMLPETIGNDSEDLGERAKELIKRGGNYHKHVIKAGVWKEGVQGYLASVNYADAMLGMLLDNLSNSAYADNTIVVVWSDHGWQLGEKEHWRKFALWENVIRTVHMIHVPKGMQTMPAGSNDGNAVNSISSLIDIYPTLMDLCNLPKPNYLDGESLVPLLEEPTEESERAAITSYDFGDYSVRYKDWHLIQYVDESVELYNLENDPNEWTNLASLSEYEHIKNNLLDKLPENRKQLPEESLIQLMEHHIPPVKSKEYYFSKERRDWLKRFESE